MTDILVDSNVIIDILTEDKKWYTWSASQLEKYADQCALYINPIIYAEVSIGFSRIEDLENALPEEYFKKIPIAWEACFLAGKAFKEYKTKGGARSSTLPDFFIGAHALVNDLILLTRDKSRYLTYFPKLKLITPAH